MKRLIGILIATLFVGLVGFRLYQQWSGGEAAATGLSPGAFARTVGVTTAELGDVRQVVTLVGSLRAEETVNVTPRINGRVVAVFVDLGDHVSRGQVLARLEDDELQQQVQQSEASLEVSRAVLEQRSLELQNQEATLERARGLQQQGLVSAEELEQTQTRRDVAVSQLNLARAQLLQAEAGLRELRIRLDQTRIVAPISGQVARRYADIGTLVSATTPVVTLVNLSKLRLIANVAERDLVALQPGALGRVHVDALPGMVFDGNVARVSPQLDPQTRTAQVEIEIPNADGELRGEMFARVELELETKRDTLRVPRQALVVRGNDEGVYVVEEEIARFRVVRIGLTQQDWIEVIEGLQVGDRVVTEGSNLIRDGDRVRITGSRGTST